MKILVVDDSMFVRKFIIKFMKQAFEDVQITECGNGLEAYDAYRADEFDYVLTDLLMPIMTGQKFLEKITELGKPYNCFVCSADIQDGTKKELENFDIIEVVPKPLTQDKMTQITDYIKEHYNG